MRPGHPTRWVAAAVVSLLLATSAGCRDGDDPDGRSVETAPATSESTDGARSLPSVEDVACAPDILRAVVGAVDCRYVVVREQRGEVGSSPSVTAGESSVRVHVTRIRPPDGTASGAPLLVAGTHIGATPNYLGIAPLAQRTGRDVLVVDLRGTGHSQPSLDCPEVHEAVEAGLATESVQAAAAAATTVAACARRLRDAGVDPSHYGLAAMADDLEDIRVALGLTDVDVVSYGSTAAAVVPFVTRHADAVRTVVLDSPLWAGIGGPSAEDALAGVVDGVLVSCREDAECVREHGTPTLMEARREAAREPLRLVVPAGSGGSDTFVLDEERLLRVLRQMTSDGGSSGLALTVGAIPRLVADVSRRDAAALDKWLAPVLAAQEAFCLGRSPSCLAPRHHLSVGSWLTVVCDDLGGRRDPWLDLPTGEEGTSLCANWPARESAGAPTPAAWTVPTLVVIGSRTAYSSPAIVRAALGGVPDLTWVEDPAAGSAVMARTTCVLEFRDRWLNAPAPTSPPPCLRDLEVPFH